jgi:lysozyme family protein
MQSNWKQSFDYMQESEGGFSDDPDDNGNWLPDGRKGCTNLGVTQTTWESWVGRQSNEKEMRNLTHALVEPMYRRKFWDAAHCNDLPNGVDYLVFDFAVNAGVGRSAKTLQSAVGATPDGAIGPLTLTAVNAYNNPETVINLFSIAKEEWYKSLKNPKYEQGWLNRAAIVRQRALKMVG